jgi:hypothetical protein
VGRIPIGCGPIDVWLHVRRPAYEVIFFKKIAALEIFLANGASDFVFTKKIDTYHSFNGRERTSS